MASFAIVGHLARTDGDFSLNDLPGAGRMDVLCRCVNASLFLSHDLRRDVDCYLVLLGGPKGPKTVKFSGEVRSARSPRMNGVPGHSSKRHSPSPAGASSAKRPPGCT